MNRLERALEEKLRAYANLAENYRKQRQIKPARYWALRGEGLLDAIWIVRSLKKRPARPRGGRPR